jgi:phosphonate utilization transcriptional regulator
MKAMDDIAPGLALRIRRTQSLTSLVRQELDRMIENGELKSGDRLNEIALANRLGVSRGPIREAFRGLEQSGLVEVVVNRGVFVRQVDLSEVVEIYEVRSALFGRAGRLLAPKITPEQIAVLSDLLERMEEAVQADDLNTYYPINLEFHRRLLDFAGNRRIQLLYRSLIRELHLFRRKALVAPGSLTASNAEHRAIVKALAARDAGKAEELMSRHVMGSRYRLEAAGEPVEAPAPKPRRRRSA